MQATAWWENKTKFHHLLHLPQSVSPLPVKTEQRQTKDQPEHSQKGRLDYYKMWICNLHIQSCLNRRRKYSTSLSIGSPLEGDSQSFLRKKIKKTTKPVQITDSRHCFWNPVIGAFLSIFLNNLLTPHSFPTQLNLSNPSFLLPGSSLPNAVGLLWEK